MKVLVYVEGSAHPLIADSLVAAAREFVEYSWEGPVLRIETAAEAPSLVEAFNKALGGMGGDEILDVKAKLAACESAINEAARPVREVGDMLAETGWETYTAEEVGPLVTAAAARIRGLLVDLVALRAERDGYAAAVETKLTALTAKLEAP